MAWGAWCMLSKYFLNHIKSYNYPKIFITKNLHTKSPKLSTEEPEKEFFSPNGCICDQEKEAGMGGWQCRWGVKMGKRPPNAYQLRCPDFLWEKCPTWHSVCWGKPTAAQEQTGKTTPCNPKASVYPSPECLNILGVWGVQGVRKVQLTFHIKRSQSRHSCL